MADEPTQPAPETTASTSTTPNVYSAPANVYSAPATTGPDGQPWDPQRAMHTIDQLREKERQGEKAAKELAAAQEQLAKLREEQESEQEKREREHREALDAAASTQAENRRLAARLAVATAAPRLGITDIDLALGALPEGAIEYDEAGAPTNTDEVLKALLKKHPSLKATAEPEPAEEEPDEPAKQKRASADAGAGSAGKGKPELTAAEMAAADAAGMTYEEYGAYKGVNTSADYDALKGGASD